MSREIENGMGFAGLGETKAEREAERQHIQEVKRLRAAETVRALEAAEHAEKLERLRQFVRDQWARVPPVPHTQPGSYDRGYQNGMADILRGLEETLAWTPKKS